VYGLNNSQQGQEIFFLFSTSSTSALGTTQTPVPWVPGALPQGVERPEREADHSPPYIAEVNNGEAIPPLPHMPSWHSP
jgi:hypothetical protein